MVKVSNVFGDVYSGQAGKAGVFAHWKGRQYRRKYVIPSNPNTIKQQQIRGYFAEAVTEWHTWLSLMRLAYDYLATGQVLSGFNLLVGRWVKAKAAAEEAPLDPLVGVLQIGQAQTLAEDEAIPVGAGPHTLNFHPIKITIITFTPGTSGVDLQATVWLEAGRVYIEAAMTGEVTIDYESGGRVITGEVLGTDPNAGEIFHTARWPIDQATVHIKEATVEVDAMEILFADGEIYFTNTAPGDATATLTYTHYTAVADAKVEVSKVDTSFICWRRYSDADGILGIGLTIEDQNYDQVISRSGYETIYLADRAASDLAKDEYYQPTAI